MNRTVGGEAAWPSSTIDVGTEGGVVHRWYPSHIDVKQRAHIGVVICLLQCTTHAGHVYYVPVAENCLQFADNQQQT